MTLYPLFGKKLEKQPPDAQFRVLITFEDISNRDKFIEEHKDLKNIGTIDFIPSVYTNLKKEQINNLEKNELIKQLEEDQKLHFSMLDAIEILELKSYKNSHISYKGNSINVGIIDDGINKGFPSIPNSSHLLDKSKIQQNEISHGTIMASIIGNQFKDVDDNYIGIAPNVNLIDFDLSNSNKEYYFSNVLKIFDKISKKNIDVDILLISLVTKEPSDGKDILSLACNLFVERGLIIVSPAGNFGPESHSIGSPGAAEKVITIGALTKELTIPNYSGRGPTLDERVKPDLCLPSSDVVVPLSDNLQVRVTGTSVSASIGVGIIALLKEYDSNISYNEILAIMRKSRTDLDYNQISQGIGTIKITDIFRNLDLFHEKLVSYNYLIKKSLKVTIEFMVVFLILFYIFFFFKLA